MDHPFRTGAPSISQLAIEDGSLLSGRYWGELRTFLAVAKGKSLNRAADELGVSRMTAGREIRRLQDAIGAQLVVFSKTGAALTRRGEELARARCNGSTRRFTRSPRIFAPNSDRRKALCA
jgi:Bacterial regulatory helix-turn-helix protein, lysR family